jgi:hypothetical protein
MNATDAENMLAQLQQGRPKHARKGMNELDDLDLRLLETVSWCTQYSVLRRVRRCLRPQRLAPPPLPMHRRDAVDWVISERRSQCGDVTLNEVFGRLLVYFPDASLADGAAEIASKDFFDVHNAPPCATWIGYFEDQRPDPSYSSYVLAWVPQLFLEFARDGVAANPEGCIVWLSDTHLALQHIVRHCRFGKGLT